MGRAGSAYLLNFFERKVLDADQRIAGCTDPDHFIKLRLNGHAITVLRVLSNKDHEKRNYRRASVDDELPSVREVEYSAHVTMINRATTNINGRAES